MVVLSFSLHHKDLKNERGSFLPSALFKEKISSDDPGEITASNKE
jgi:hypothetical protein